MPDALDPARLADVRAAMDGPVAKVRHALKHLGSFRYQARKWANAEPPAISWEPDDGLDEEGWRVGRLKVVREPPEVIALLAADYVHDLRSALDQSVYQLARLTTDSPAGTQFPIFLDPDDYTRKRGKYPSYRDSYLAGVPDPYRTFIDECQPFNSATPTRDPLAILQAFSNVDKHRLINATFVNPGGLTVAPIGYSVESWDIRYPPPGPVRDGAELFRFRPNGAIQLDMDVEHFGFEVMLDIDLVWGPGAVSNAEFSDILSTVLQIVVTFKAGVLSPAGLIEPNRAILKDSDEWARYRGPSHGSRPES